MKSLDQLLKEKQELQDRLQAEFNTKMKKANDDILTARILQAVGENQDVALDVTLALVDKFGFSQLLSDAQETKEPEPEPEYKPSFSVSSCNPKRKIRLDFISRIDYNNNPNADLEKIYFKDFPCRSNEKPYYIGENLKRITGILEKNNGLLPIELYLSQYKGGESLGESTQGCVRRAIKYGLELGLIERKTSDNGVDCIALANCFYNWY